METLVSDFEKTMAMGAAILEEVRNVRQKLEVDTFVIDMYGSDPGGVYGVISTRAPSTTSAPLLRNYNGPWMIETLLISWAAGVESASLQIGTDRVIPLQGPGAGFTGQSVQAAGNVTNPGANTIIASISAASLLAAAPIGTIWSVNWTAELQGTVTAADGNNMNLIMPIGTIRETGEFPGVAGVYPQLPVLLQPASGNNISVSNPNAASGAAAIYAAEITATPQLGAEGGAVLLNPQGLKIQVARDDDITLTVTPARPCYIEAMGTADLRRTDYLQT